MNRTRTRMREEPSGDAGAAGASGSDTPAGESDTAQPDAATAGEMANFSGSGSVSGTPAGESDTVHADAATASTAGGAVSAALAGGRGDPWATTDVDGITILTLPAGEHITRTVAERKAADARKLAGGVARPLLIDISGVLSIDRAARSVMGNARISTAIALLGSSPVDRVIGNFMLGGQPPSCPVEFFSSESEALAWLSGFRRYPESNEL